MEHKGSWNEDELYVERLETCCQDVTLLNVSFSEKA